MPYAPAITTYGNAKPTPRAEVLFSVFAPGTTKVTVWRESKGRKYRVRGAVSASVAGSLTRIDTEIPFNVAVTYWAEMFDAAGISLGETDRTETILWCGDTWIHNPLDPENAITAVFRSDAAQAIRRPVTGQVVYPQGRRVGVVVASQRQGITAVALNIVVTDEVSADKFQSMTGDYEFTTVPVLCIRKGSGEQLLRLPSPFFVAVLAADEVAFDYRFGGETLSYEMQGDEVSPPAEGIAVPLLTRADLNAWYQTNADLNADNATRLDVNRRYDLAGTA